MPRFWHPKWPQQGSKRPLEASCILKAPTSPSGEGALKASWGVLRASWNLFGTIWDAKTSQGDLDPTLFLPSPQPPPYPHFARRAYALICNSSRDKRSSCHPQPKVILVRLLGQSSWNQRLLEPERLSKPSSIFPARPVPTGGFLAF